MLLCISYIYCPKTKLREGNVFTPVCQSFCSRGGCLPLVGGGSATPPWADTPRQTPLGRHPPGQTPPWADTPPCPVHAGIHTLLRSTVKKRAVRIPLECILVKIYFVTFQQYPPFYGDFPIYNVAFGKPVTIEPSDGTCGSTPQRSTIMRPLRGGVQNVRRHYSLYLTVFQELYCITFHILTTAFENIKSLSRDFYHQKGDDELLKYRRAVCAPDCGRKFPQNHDAIHKLDGTYKIGYPGCKPIKVLFEMFIPIQDRQESCKEVVTPFVHPASASNRVVKRSIALFDNWK